MTHCFQAVCGVKATVLSLMMKVQVLSDNVKRLFQTLSLSFSHTYFCDVTRSHKCTFLAREKEAIHVPSERSFYACIFHIEFLLRLTSTAAKRKHSWLFIENKPQYPAETPCFLTKRLQGIWEILT